MGDWPNRFKDLSDIAITASGPPTTGTWNPGDVAVDTSGVLWVCTAAGTPGTWVSQVSRELAYAEITANTSTFSAIADIAGLTVTFTAGTRPVIVRVEGYSLQQGAGAGIPSLTVADSSNNAISLLTGGSVAANSYSASLSKSRRLNTLTPGTSYTYKVRGSTSASTALLVAASTFPASIQVVEAP